MISLAILEPKMARKESFFLYGDYSSIFLSKFIEASGFSPSVMSHISPISTPGLKSIDFGYNLTWGACLLSERRIGKMPVRIGKNGLKVAHGIPSRPCPNTTGNHLHIRPLGVNAAFSRSSFVFPGLS